MRLPWRTWVLYTFGVVVVLGMLVLCLTFLFGSVLNVYESFAEALSVVAPFGSALLVFWLAFSLLQQRRGKGSGSKIRSNLENE